MLNLHTRFGYLKIFDASQAVEILSDEMSSKMRTYHFLNAFVISEASKNRQYFEILTRGICFCDSRPLEAYSRFVRSPIKQLRGVDFLKAVLPDPASGRQLIIGGTQKNQAELIQAIAMKFDKSISISYHQPEFSDDISVIYTSSLRKVRTVKPNTIWLGIGTPKQDLLADLMRNKVKANIFCVGAAIGFLVSEVVESPKWLQWIGLEWLYRLTKEPGRLWRRYLFGNLAFLRILLKDLTNRSLDGIRQSYRTKGN